jgi:hypothetical protein
MQRALPRYFVSRMDNPSAGTGSGESIPLSHLLDQFFIHARHLEEREWFVALDAIGNLQAIRGDGNGLPPGLRNQLAYHEISGQGRGRSLEVEQFYLFTIQLLEQPAGTPGVNDPLYLYGTLFGPFPETSEGIEGQLTITRGDLLGGLVHEAGHAFHYQQANTKSTPDRRSFHVLLPGDTEEETRRGRGVILAYPLLPIELITDDVANELIVSRLLHDVLVALKEDLARENIRSPLTSWTLPTHDRRMLEQELITQGYVIEENSAVKKVEGGKGFQGLLASVFGALMQDRLELPPEGTIDQFLAIAHRTIESLPGWPQPRAVALRTKVGPPPAHRPRAASSFALPGPTPAASAPPLRINIPPKNASTGPPDWMRDFMAAHRRPDSPPPRLTTLAETSRSSAQRPSSASSSSPGAPDWMNDFMQASTSAPRPTHDDQSSSESPDVPDWMNDFK